MLLFLRGFSSGTGGARCAMGEIPDVLGIPQEYPRSLVRIG
jgi:hypothetical protein